MFTGLNNGFIKISFNYIKLLSLFFSFYAGIPKNEQTIFFEGNELEDNRTLSYYKIKNNSNLYLVAKIHVND